MFNSSKQKFFLITFKNSVPSSKKTQHLSIANISYLILFKEIITVYSAFYSLNVLMILRVTDVTAGGTYSYH
jgi:hypothetical protein